MTLKPWQCFVLMVASGYISSEIASYRAAEKASFSEAQAQSEATWLCNYAASLSAKYGEMDRLICLGHQFDKHFEKASD